MGQIAQTLAYTSISGTLQLFTFELSEGILYSAAVIPSGSSVEPTEAYAEIGIMHAGNTANHIVAVLSNAYLGSPNRLGWTGRHPIVTDDRIYVQLAAVINTDFRLTWLQFMPSADLNAKQTLDA
jgi:hypothetical protein